MSVSPPTPLPSTLWGAFFHRWTWRMAWRDSRSQRQRLAIFSMAIVAGVSALVAVHSLKASLQKGIVSQAKALLGSDLQVISRDPISDSDAAQVAALAKHVSRETSFSSMLYFPGADAARLVNVRGLEPGYPFYGAVETEPASAWARLQHAGGVLLEPAILQQYGAKPGDKVKLGSSQLTILGSLKKAAPRGKRFSGFAPDAYVRLSDLPQTGLLGASSFASYHLHLELPDRASPQLVKEKLLKEFPSNGWRLETPEDRGEALGRSLENFEQFLGLVALAALALGAIGVAGAVHSHVRRRAQAVAVLRCLGCPGNLAFGVYLAQTAALGAAGALVGAVVGTALHLGALTFFRESLPVAVDPVPEWGVIAQSTAAGFAICCGFALLPLLGIRRISPAAALREGASLAGAGRGWRGWGIYLLLAAAVVLLTRLNVGNWSRAAAFSGGLIIAFGLLFGVAHGVAYAARRLMRPSWPYVIRQGISNLYRPRNQTLLFVFSLGLGTFLLVTILFAQDLLGVRLSVAQGTENPNLYLVDIQADQTAAVRGVIEGMHLPVLESTPMVTMRISSVKGIPIEKMGKEPGASKRVLQREYRSTFRDHLKDTESIIAGNWIPHAEDPTAPVPISLEEDISKELKVGVGDEMTLDVQGVEVRTRVASLRKVDWKNFNLNFFMLFPTGVLEDAPSFQVMTTRTVSAEQSGELQRTMAKQFPNVSVIDLTQILETVRGILDKISRVVSVLAAFTVLAGLPIIIGTLLNGREDRLRESILLRTLGASARQVRAILLAEYLALGILSAIAGLVLAIGANAAMAIFMFEASPWPNFPVVALALASAAVISVAGGAAVSRGISSKPPLALLRDSA